MAANHRKTSSASSDPRISTSLVRADMFDYRRPHRFVLSWIRRQLITRIKDGEEFYMLLLATLVGLLMGCVSAGFRQLINLSHHYLFEDARAGRIAGHEVPPLAHGLLVLILPALGGLVVGFFVYRLLKLGGGHGVPNVMKAIATGNVNLSPWMAVKSSTSAITIGSGGSAGPEGPIIEIGSVVGSMVGQEAQVSKERVGTLIGCGAAAGIAAVFNAPIGGVFLALELLMKDFAVRTFGPVVVAAVVASVTNEALLPNQPVFPSMDAAIKATVDPSYGQVLMFAALGLMTGIIGALLVYTIYRMHDFFESIARVPLWLKPAIGGLLVGAIGVMLPDVIGEGYEFVRNKIIHAYEGGAGVITPMTALFFIFIALVKILASSLTLGSGGTGGSFAPAMVTGAMTGAGFGVLCQIMFPETAPAVTVFALVGMAGLVSSALNIHIAGILIIYEISGANYRLVLPLMITVAMSSFVSALLRQGSVYTLSLLRDGFDVDEALRRVRDPLRRIPVRKLMKRQFTRLKPDDNLDEVIRTFSASEDDAFAVVDERGCLLGLISTRDIRGVLNMAGIGEAIIAADAADSNPRILYPDSPATDALAIFGNSEMPAIPVLEKPGSQRIVGMVSRVDVLAVYKSQTGTS